MTYIEQEILKRYPVLEQVQQILQDKDEVFYSPRTWVWIYSRIAAREKDSQDLWKNRANV